MSMRDDAHERSRSWQKCPECGSICAATDYDCDACGWEFGFAMHSPEPERDIQDCLCPFDCVKYCKMAQAEKPRIRIVYSQQFNAFLYWLLPVGLYDGPIAYHWPVTDRWHYPAYHPGLDKAFPDFRKGVTCRR